MRTVVRVAIAFSILLIVGIIAVSKLKGTSAPQGPAVRLFQLGQGSEPRAIVAAPDGNLWYSIWNHCGIGRLSPREPFPMTRFPCFESNTRPDGIAVGPDGALWCVNGEGFKILRIPFADPTKREEFKRLGSYRNIYGIAPAHDGTFWMAGVWRLYRMRATVPPEYEEYPFQFRNSSAEAITVDERGDGWFTRSDGVIGRVTRGSPLEPEIFKVPTEKSRLRAITIGPDAAVWFTDYAGNFVGRLDPVQGVLQEFPLPTPDAKPLGIAPGPDGALWFAENGGKQIGRIGATPPFAITEFEVPAPNSRPWAVTAGPDGNIWFTDNGADAVGQIVLAAVQDRIRLSEDVARTYGTRVTSTQVRPGPSGAPKDGQLNVTTDADCTVSLDGSELFRATPANAKSLTLAPGPHTVSAVGAVTGRRLTKTVVVFAGHIATVAFDGLADPSDPWKDYQPQNPRIEFVAVAPGEFWMGSDAAMPAEQPRHRVRITRGFELGKFEVTQAQWQAVMGQMRTEETERKTFGRIGPVRIPSMDVGDEKPVVDVSWRDTQEFLARLERLDPSHSYRLPTEAEWEYAARAGAGGEAPSNLDDVAWSVDSSSQSGRDFDWRLHRVGRLSPNPWGLFDMLGNVYEWCQDWYDEDWYKRSPIENPAGPNQGTMKVYRGGNAYQPRRTLGFAQRSSGWPDGRDVGLGFRVLRTTR